MPKGIKSKKDQPIPDGYVEVTGKCKSCNNLFITMSIMGGEIPVYCDFCPVQPSGETQLTKESSKTSMKKVAGTTKIKRKKAK